MGVVFMRKYIIDKFINTQLKEKNFIKQIQIINCSPISLKRAIRRKRYKEETFILIKAMMKDIKRLESEGIIEKNGRKWKINI